MDDFTRDQAWYDLILLVNPEDENDVMVGGIDLHRTTDGGATWSQISNWLVYLAISRISLLVMMEVFSC
jgi:hypothetical protein